MIWTSKGDGHPNVASHGLTVYALDFQPLTVLRLPTTMANSNAEVPLEMSNDVEGLGYPLEHEDGAPYPLDDIMVRNETRTVRETVLRISNGRYIMDPDFQRDFIWDISKQSKLIESCIMRIPLPVIYVAESLDGRVMVVDGLQRLSTFQRFLDDRFKLTRIGDGHPLEGMAFSDLPVHLQERVEDTQLTLHILDRSASDRARLDIFERVNSGEPLTRQQMRNAIYNGPGTRWLSRMAAHDAFHLATGNSLNPKTMRDREAINRFAAFHILGWKAYAGGDMDDFLARGIVQLNARSETELQDIERAFLDSMRRNHLLFDRHAFRKSLRQEDTGASLTVINISLFDVLSCALARIRDESIFAHVETLRNRIVKLLTDEDFIGAITYSTNSTQQVRTRFEMIDDACSDLLS